MAYLLNEGAYPISSRTLSSSLSTVGEDERWDIFVSDVVVEDNKELKFVGTHTFRQ